MLILLAKGEKPKGFFLKRKAKAGKLPPVIRGIQLGKYPCVLLQVYGKVTQNNRFILPYLARGDVVIPQRSLQGLGFSEPWLEEMTRRQCVNTAKGYVTSREKSFLTALYDPCGECVGVAAEFCALGNPVWVVTPREELYAPCTEYALLEYGNPPTIGGRMPQKVGLVVAPYGIPAPLVPAQTPVVAPGYIWANRKDLTVAPERLPELFPQFDPIEVAAGCLAVFGMGMEEKARLFLPNEK